MKEGEGGMEGEGGGVGCGSVMLGEWDEGGWGEV